MISDVDASLGALFSDALSGSGAEFAFDAPTKDWVSRRNGPVVDLFLYDIREDPTRRDVMAQPVRSVDGRVIDRRSPPRRFRLSYLLSAWTQRPEEEHRLLSRLLAALVTHDRIPDRYLKGALADQPLPVLLELALPPAKDRSLSDVWNALGGELKPSLDLVAIAPLHLARSFPAGPPVMEEAHLHVRRLSRPTDWDELEDDADQVGRRERARVIEES